MPQDQSQGSESTTCPDCKRTSWNPNDVLFQYCANCDKFYGEHRTALWYRGRLPQLVRLHPEKPIGMIFKMANEEIGHQ